jgi:hypothetical protein
MFFNLFEPLTMEQNYFRFLFIKEIYIHINSNVFRLLLLILLYFNHLLYQIIYLQYESANICFYSYT